MDFGRQLADLMQGSEPAETPAPAKRIAKVIDPERLRRLTGLAEAAATFGTGLAASVPAGLAGMSQMIPTRGRTPDINKAAQTVEDVQSALTYLPRTPTGQRVLERGIGAMEMFGAPAEYIGEKTLQYTGSPGAATAANVLLDPVNFIGMPGSGKATVAATKAAGRAAAAAPRVAGEMLQDLVIGSERPGSMRAQRGAIKMKGGNWLAGEVEGATRLLKTPYDPDVALDDLRQMRQRYGDLPAYARDEQTMLRAKNLNNWIDKKLNRYIRNEMATPEDPVRKLAERGVSHMQGLDQHEGYVGIGTRMARQKAGLPEKGFGESLLARNWEAKADQAIHPRTAAELSDPNQWFAESAPSFQKQLEANPWLAKISPDTPVYERAATAENFDQMLGFSHLIDELKNSIRPDSDLPAHLRWKPEDLEKVTMEQAVRRVHDINEYRAQKKAEANEALARNPATVTFKEYPTIPGSDKPNEKGLAWKEIRGPEAAVDKAAYRQQLQDALKYEGDVMGHCVGGYCDDVLSGRTQIYSLRDKKGEPHVTIEVRPNQQPYPVSGEAFARLDPQTRAQYRQYVMEWRRRNPEVEELTDELVSQALKEAGVPASPPEIIQIKGKANKAPKDEYLPFVQDFVRNGNWSRVGDIQNTGLEDIGNYKESVRAAAEKAYPGQRFLTLEQIQPLVNAASEKKMKAGGSVHISDNPDTMALELAGGGGVGQERDWRSKIAGGGIRGIITRGLLGMDPPEDMTPREREIYENTARASAPALGLAAAPAAIVKGAKTAKTAKTVYPQAEALERARKNAVEMLGLPENNTAMDRARAMGFDDNWFHGTNRDFTAFENSMLGTKTKAKSAQKAHFAAKNPELSNTYVSTDHVFPVGRNAAPPVYESLFKNKDAFAEFNAAPDWDSQWRVLEKYGMNYGSGQVMPLMIRLGNQRVKDYGGTGYRDVTYNDELKAAKKGKKDSVVFKNTFDPGPHEGRNVQSNVAAVFDPSRIRSRFAAFDPAEMDKPDLLKKKGGAVKKAAGGAIKAAAKAAERAAKAAKPDVLPAAEREANLARMLQESKTKTRLYHGTKAHDEYADEPGQAIRQFASSPTWLAKEPYTASGYSGGTGSTYPVYAQIKKPLVLGFDANDEAAKAFAAAKRLGVDVEYIKGMSAPEKAWEVINHPSFIDAVERAGYDGISIKEGGYRTFGVLDPRRIKSATGNRGTFDVTNPDITKKRGGKVSITDNLDTMRLAVQKRK